MTGLIYNWALENWVEMCGMAAGLIYIWFSIRQSILTWPVGLITAFLYIWIFFDAQIFAQMGLQFYYVLISIYGWWSWQHGESGNSKDKMLYISRTGIRLWVRLFVVNILLFIVISYILVKVNSPIAYWDAFITSLSIIATWMLARKKFEHWLLWMLIDTISIGLYIYRGLYPTTILFIAYTVMAIIGYFEWRRDLKKIECQAKTV